MNADRSLAPDPEAAIAFLELLHPGGPWVLTAITPDGPATTETFYKADTVAKWIERQNANRNIYWMPAETTGPLRKKASKDDVARTFFLWADLDGNTDAGRLNGHGPAPTTIVASGGGLHLYWALAEPIHDKDEIEARNRWLANQIDADHCWNCDRILRVAGTINWPNKKKRSQGRVPVLARCAEHHPDRVYDFDDFGQVEAEAKEAEPAGDADIQLLTLDDLPTDVREKLHARARRLIRDGPQSGEYRDDRSRAVLAVTFALVRAGASDSQIAGILLNPELPIHAHIQEQKGHGPRAYVARQIERARERVADTERPSGGEKPNGEATAYYDFEGPEEFKKLRRPKFVIPGLIGDNTTFLLFSPSGHYKSTLIALLFVLAANGLTLDGSRIEPVPAIIIANEDAFGLMLRLLAVATVLDLALANVRVLSIGDFKLDRPECLNRLIESVKAKLSGWRPALVVDHYDVSMDRNPTDPEAGGPARDAVRYLLASGLFRCVGLLAHTPWTTPDRAKLPISLWANFDGRFGLIKREDGTAQFKVDHVKNGESGYALDVVLRKVTVKLEDGDFETVMTEVRAGDDGKPIRAKPQSKREPALSDDQKTALKAISRAIIERPAKPPCGLDLPRGDCTTEKRKAEREGRQ